MIMMNHAPSRPAFPTTQPILRYMITPNIVSSVGVNTPPKVPNFLALISFESMHWPALENCVEYTNKVKYYNKYHLTTINKIKPAHC